MDRMSLLPMIKCSSCGVDIEILQLADHVCPVTTDSVAAPSSPDSLIAPSSPKLERAATFGGPSFSKRSDRQAPSGRMPAPPRIDSNAANKPFRPLESSSMTEHSDSRSRSPSARPPPRSPFKMNRSVTTPVPRALAFTSPDLPPNMDCAFPAFPRKNATPQSAKSRARDHLEPNSYQKYAAPSPLFAPLSPRTNGGENITKRLDAIASGPFDRKAESRPSTSGASKPPSRGNSAPGHRRTVTQDSSRSRGSMSQQRASVTSHASHSSAYSSRSIGLPSSSRATLDGPGGFAPAPLSPSFEQSQGIDAFLDRLQKETVTSSHIRTASKESGWHDSRERKEPPPRPRRPSERDLPPNDMANTQKDSYIAYSNSNIQSRAHSRHGSASETMKNLDSPQILRPPPPLLATAFGLDPSANSLHTPSDSGHSDDSYASTSFRSAASSRSSPPGSVAGHSREASKLSHSEYIAGDNFERTTSPESYMDLRTDRENHSHAAAVEPRVIPRSLSPGYSNMPESPMDPAIALGTAFERPSRARLPTRDPALMLTNSPSRNVDMQQPWQSETRRPKTGSKGNCRGCSEPIIGKSVKDSSGRLTGRYHKQCFVCRTCADPFPTAEFYVFENSPYCEQHYHKLNGSLCGCCNFGIEGQYLETDTRQKYHPRCFTCSTCRVVLRDGYFDVNGRRYCERHAQSAAAPPRDYLGPSGYRPRNLQKRGTRLMMMA
ncbi:hypothetical protein ACN47E_001889 [Coniothyrium glycines]